MLEAILIFEIMVTVVAAAVTNSNITDNDSLRRRGRRRRRKRRKRNKRIEIRQNVQWKRRNKYEAKIKLKSWWRHESQRLF